MDRERINRKQRRAALKQSPPGAGDSNLVGQLFAQAIQSQRQNRLAEAARLYKRLLLLKPDHAEANNNIGCVLQAQGKLAEASARFAHSLTLMPQLSNQFADICATLISVLPPIAAAMQRAAAAWPQRLTVDQMLGSSGLTAVAKDPLLLRILRSVPVRDIALERVLTTLRTALLDAAIVGGPASEAELMFCCALAQQCFINEYVFATTPDEDAQVDRLRTAIDAGATVAPEAIAAFAMYRPLHALPGAASLLDCRWPAALDDVLNQQLREPSQERELRAVIPRLTPIDDEISQRVRQQYEENPYPRWVDVAGDVAPVALDRELRNMFPSAALTPLAKDKAIEVLVAGCGTGYHAIGTAQKYRDVQVLAVDLSLSSLCYAKRKTPASLAARITYAQADILQLAGIGRSFDMIDASGVLHHMADPLAGWHILLGLLSPGGLMHLGFYSELGRRDVVAARAFIAERGFTPTPAEIRRCRQELLDTPRRSLTRFNDFFSTSECRDLLFHVQESRLSIPALKAFIAGHGLRFIGFEFEPATLQRYRALFANADWSMGDLDRWHAVESEYPDTFAGMYNLWIQKT